METDLKMYHAAKNDKFFILWPTLLSLKPTPQVKQIPVSDALRSIDEDFETEKCK